MSEKTRDSWGREYDCHSMSRIQAIGIIALILKTGYSTIDADLHDALTLALVALEAQEASEGSSDHQGGH